MDLTEFQAEFPALCSAFDKKVRPEMAQEYFAALEGLNHWQWKELCAWAKHELDRFPTISILYRSAVDHNFILTSHDERPDPWIAVQCSCGGSFVVPRVKIESGGNEYFTCPMCRKKSYSAEHLLQHLDGATCDFFSGSHLDQEIEGVVTEEEDDKVR